MLCLDLFCGIHCGLKCTFNINPKYYGADLGIGVKYLREIPDSSDLTERDQVLVICADEKRDRHRRSLLMQLIISGRRHGG